MIVLAIILAVLHILTATTVYLSIAVGIINMSTVVGAYEWAHARFVKLVLYVVRKPLAVQVLAIAAIASIQQIILLQLPSSIVLATFMSNWAEEKMLSTGLSRNGDAITEFVRHKLWLKIMLVPAVIYAVVTTFMLTTLVSICIDPHTSSSTLLALCIPVGASLAIWYAEEQLPIDIRRVLGTVPQHGDRVGERPSSGMKRKVLVVAGTTICAIFTLVVGAHFYRPRILRIFMGRKLDTGIYLSGVAAAVIMAAVVASIQFDGQTKQLSAAAAVDAEDWDDRSVYTYYHSLLVITCIIVLVAFVSFPLFNTPFFCHRMLTMHSAI
jgi:hypothetical protein